MPGVGAPTRERHLGLLYESCWRSCCSDLQPPRKETSETPTTQIWISANNRLIVVRGNPVQPFSVFPRFLIVLSTTKRPTDFTDDFCKAAGDTDFPYTKINIEIFNSILDQALHISTKRRKENPIGVIILWAISFAPCVIKRNKNRLMPCIYIQ